MFVWTLSWITKMTDRPAPGYTPARGEAKFPDLTLHKPPHGVRFLYRITLGLPDPHFYLPGAKTPSTLPQILNRDELVRLFTVARLRRRQQGQGDASRRRRVHPPLPPACAAARLHPAAPLRIARQSFQNRQARPMPSHACQSAFNIGQQDGAHRLGARDTQGDPDLHRQYGYGCRFVPNAPIILPISP